MAIFSATVDYTEGGVTIDGEPAEAGQILNSRFTVVTGEASYVAVIFNEKNIMYIDESTVADIDLWKSVMEVQLDRGIIASALRNIAKLGASDTEGFRLTTPTAVAGVGGTVFFVKAESEEISYICSCNGILHLQDEEGGNDQIVESAHHTAYRYIERDGLIVTESVPVLFHTDEIMELGASRIGETIDWTTIGP